MNMAWHMCRQNVECIAAACVFFSFSRHLQADTWKIISAADDKTLKVCVLNKVWHEVRYIPEICCATGLECSHRQSTVDLKVSH